MSQVKKLKTGEKIPKHATGSIIIDGTKFEGEDAINEFGKWAGQQNDDSGALSDVYRALLNGRNLVYTSGNNTISGLEDSDISADDHAKKHLSKPDEGKFKKKWQATWGHDEHNYRKGLSNLQWFTTQNLHNDNKSETPNDLINISGDSGWFTWDENGNLTQDPTNSLLLKRINQVRDYLNSDTEGRKKYKHNFSDNSIAALDAFKEDARNDWGNYTQTLLNAINSNNLSDDQKKWLAFLNIGENISDEDRINKETKKKWTDSGWGNLYDRLGNVATLNDDGTLELNPGQTWGWNLGDLDGSNIWFNDDFYKSKYAADGSMDAFKGLTLYNNKLYQSDNPTLSRILNTEGGFNSRMKSGDWVGADELIKTRFTDAARENPEFLDNSKYSEFLSNNPTYMFSDLTGLYDVDGMGSTDQLIQYYDLNDNSFNGAYRRYAPKFAILDKNGKLLQEITDSSLLKKILNGKVRESGLTAHPRVVGTGNEAYDGKYYEDITGKNGKVSGFRIYHDPKDPNGNVILHMPKIKGSGLDEDADLVLPKELAQILLSNDKLWDNIAGNAQNKKNFISAMSKLIQSHARIGSDINHNNVLRAIGFFGPLGLLGSERQQMKKLGFKDEDLDNIMKALREARSGSREDRREDYIAYTPSELKRLGGKIENLRKFQDGGKAGGTTKSTAVSEKRVDAKVKTPQNAAGLLEIGSDNWTDDDTKDLMALGLDLGSLGFAFNPVTSGIAAGTGAAASTLRFAANRGRGTRGAGGQYVLDLLMDAASLVPGMKAFKTASKVKKALPTLLKLASVAGLGTAFVNTANKIANGEKFTVRDASILVNGITAGVNIGKSGGFGRKTKKVTEFVGKEPTVGFKAGENGAKPEGVVESLKLDRTKLSEVDSPEAFKKLVVSTAKKSGDNNVTLENVADRYDLSSFISNNGKSWSPSWNPKSWLKINKKGIEKLNDKAFNLKTEGKRVEFTPEEISKMSAFEKWHRGLTGYNQMYNKTILGENPGSYTTVRKTVSVPDVVKVGSKQIRFSKAEQQLLQETPVMQQFNKFKELARAKSDSLTDSDLETAFRGLLKETPKRFDIVFDRDLTTKTTGQQPSWYRGRTEGLSRVTDQEGVTTATRRRSYDTRMGVARPHIILPLKLSGYEELAPESINYAPYYKKGGKIEKGQNGIITKNGIVAPNKDARYGVNLSDLLNTSTSNIAGLNGESIVNPTTRPTLTNRIGGNTSTQSVSGIIGGTTDSAFRPNWDQIINLARGAYQLRQSDRQLEEELKRTPFLKSAYQRQGLRFTESGEANALEQSANRFVQNAPSPTSDYVRYNAMQQQNMAQAENLRQQADRVRSQEFSNYLKSLLEYNEKYNLLDKQNADENAYSIWNDKNTKITAKTGHIAQNAGIVNNMGYKAEELLNRDRKIKGQEEIFNDTMKAWKTYKNAVEGLDVTDPKQVEKARQLGELYQIAIQRSKFNHPEVMYKSGGQVKIKRNSSDSWISSHTKDTQSYLKDLNKTVRDLLLKIKP